jgi:hypothetical protein
MTKHFPGGGPQNEGLDPHFEFQKGQVYPGHNFDYHLLPFEAAFAAHTAAIMPYYGVPMDQTDENVALSFNKMIITTLLREKYKYDGVVSTDWGLITDAHMGNFTWPARAWGVEHLTEPERVLKAFHHGDLDFKGDEKAEILALLAEVPTLVILYLDRPAVIPEISAAAKALLADFGTSDAAVLDVIFGRARPEGKLPFELPSSMEAVCNQKADVPYDSENPLYPFGFGLTY